MKESITFSETADQIKELKLLLDQDILTQDEYEQRKNALLFPNDMSTSAAKNQTQEAPATKRDSTRADAESSSVKTIGAEAKFDEIVAFKQLLDNGIITQDEFNQKKEELLGVCPAGSSQKKIAAKPTIRILASVIIAFVIALLMVFLLNQSYKTSAFIAPGFLCTFVVVFLLIYKTWK